LKLLLNVIKINVENKDIYESKYVLSTNSPYFMAMFQSNIIESNCSKNESIKIKELKYEQVINVFYYMHTKKIIYYNDENFIDKILGLYEVAHYFQMEDLTLKIETLLINKINIINFDKIIMFSNKYYMENFKKSTINFIYANKKDVINTSNFKEIINSSESELIYDLIKKLILENENWIHILIKMHFVYQYKLYYNFNSLYIKKV